MNMKSAYTIASLAIFIQTTGFAEGFQPKASEITSETQKFIQTKNKLKLVWWVIDDFWIASLRENRQISYEDAIKGIKPLANYIIVASVDANISQFGAFTYPTEEDARNSISIVGNNGNIYKPIGLDKINPDTKNLLAIMKPLLSNAMGQMGQNMNFFVFTRFSSTGSEVINPRMAGTFKIRVSEDEFIFRLPLAALSEKLVCSNDGEQFPSNFKFCPYHGNILSANKIQK